MNRQLTFFATVSLAVLCLSTTSAYALDPETLAAIHGAAAIGTAVSMGEIDPDVARDAVRSMKRDGVSNTVIGSLFKALAGDRTERTGRGMGSFVQDAHARGLRGRALADAIHAEQARRGIPGQVRNADGSIVAITIHDDHGRGPKDKTDHPARGHERSEEVRQDEEHRGRSDLAPRGPRANPHSVSRRRP